MLVWSGEAARTSEPPPAPAPHEPAVPSAIVSAGPPIPAYLAEKILTARSILEGERKQVTVLFADIKDSTELIRDLDPEEAQNLLDPPLHLMMQAVYRFEGTVNQVLGDGIMALFGAPIAHEDHALRACYAALAMQAAMQDYTEQVRRIQGIEMRIRVGLNSGEVVVRTIGNDLHMDYSAVGHTTHLAARMEQLATPGSIRVSSATLRLVEGLVQVNALGPIPIKGMPTAVEVFELTGASAIKRRLQAAVARGLTTFVGRDTAIAALHQALAQAGAGHGQVVAAIGEAGVGKSRLVYEFLHASRPPGWRVLESASVSYGKAIPYFPVVDLLKRYMHVEDGDDTRTIRAKVTGHIITLGEALQETIPALLALVDALPEDSPFLQLDPRQRRQRTLDALKRLLLRESQVQPLLVVCEDLHWIDTETQAVLDSLVESLPTAPLLLLVNYRPEYQHTWGNKTYYTQLRLDPLPPDSAHALLEALLGDDLSLDPLKTLLIARTEGNPFFMEEMVRTLVETKALVGAAGAYRLAHALLTIQVPPTVQAVLAARMDRLPPEEKRLLQTAAVIGTEVPMSLLQAIDELPEDTRHRGLMHLQAAEFLYETTLFPERVYTFKHALTHEVAYSSLLQERRRVLHARVVAEFERLYTERLDEHVERLAHHAFRGELWAKAHRYYQQAGAQAMSHSANREAVACFEQALVALQRLPECHNTMEQAIDLRFDLRNALLALGEYGRILDELRAVETLAEALADQHRLGLVFSYLATHFNIMGEYDGAIVSGQRTLALAITPEDLALRVGAHQHLGLAYLSLGDYRQAMAFLSRNVTCLEGDMLYERFGRLVLPSVASRAWLLWCLTELGEFAEAITPGEEGIRIAEAIDHPVSLINAYAGVGYLYLRQGTLDKAFPVLERSLALRQATNFPHVFSEAAAPLGYAYALSGRVAEALPLLEQAVEHSTARNALYRWALLVVWLSEAYLLADRLHDALPTAQRALDHARAHKERGHQAYALRLLGDIAVHPDPPDVTQAEIHYQQALILAKELHMRPLQAHCHRGLGTLYGLIGRSEHARAELSRAIDMYREMAMTFWLPQAEAALMQVE
jgi:class 3 adenylate cyclase/tetratricopeptide (TPR) repeat protein